MQFKLERFNPRRAARGVGAAEVKVQEDGHDPIYLWMSKVDIRNNEKEFGPHPELTKALEAYRSNVDFPPTDNG